MPTYPPPPVHVRAGRGQPSCGTTDGRRYLDFLSGLAVTSLGHAHPAVADAARRAGPHAAARVQPVRHRAGPEVAAHPRPADRRRRAGGRCSSATPAPRPTSAPSSWPASSAAGAATSWCQRLRHRSTAAPSPRCTPPASRPSTRRSSRCPRASATWPGTTSTPSSAALDPSVAAVLLEPVQGEGGVNPATAEYFAGRPAAVRRAGHAASWSTRCRPASAAPGGGSASSTSASCPTSSPWPRPSATACPSAPAGPGPRWPAPSSPATTPRPSAASRWPPRRPGPCWPTMEAEDVPGPGRRAAGARLTDALLAAARRRRRCGASACCSPPSSTTASTPGRSPPRCSTAGLVVNAVTPDRAAPRPVAARHRRRDRRGRRHPRRRCLAAARVTRHFLEIDDLDARRARRRCSTWPSDADPATVAGRPGRRRCSSRSRRCAPGTRCEMAVVQLGGHPVTIRRRRGRPRRRARRSRTSPGVLAGYHAAIGARVFDHAAARAHGRRRRRCRSSTCCPTTATRARPWPTCSPCARSSATLAGRTVAWVGDYNNVARSLGLGGRDARAWRCGSPARRATARPTPTSTGSGVLGRRRPVVDADPHEAVDGRRRRLHRRVGVDGPGGRGRGAPPGVRGLHRSTTGSWPAAARRRRLPALPARPPGRGGHRRRWSTGPAAGSWSAGRTTACTPPVARSPGWLASEVDA